MSISLLAAAAGVVLALAGTIALATWCARLPRADLIAWTCAMFGLTVALGAQAAGFAAGFGPVTFRAVQLGAQVVATLGLALGLAEVAARSLPVRFAARLAVSALGIVSLVILATDPLGTAGFSKAFPAASVYYQPIPNSLLIYVLAPFTALVALIAIIGTAARSRHDPAWRATLPAVAAAAAGALALAAPGLAALASDRLHIRASAAGAFPVLCIAAAALTWLAGSRVRRIRLDVVHQEDDDDDEDETGWRHRRSWADGDDTGGYDPLTDAGGRGRYAANGRYADDQDYGDYPGEADYEQAGHRPYSGDGGYGDGGDYGAGFGAAPAGSGYGGAALPGGPVPAGAVAGVPGVPGLGDPGQPGVPPGVPGIPPGLPAADDHEAWSRLFGQIAIYTLLEDRVGAFDDLTEEVVELVRAREPGTLVYIVHAVPSAPMQRILYEVYRDRDAFEEHKRQPYIAKFEVDRRPYVLATNVIELGLQRAKISPMPSISDLLGGPGAGPPHGAAPAAPAAPGRPAAPGGSAAPGGVPPGLRQGQHRLP
jgi:quinol monooxygenase YgiN